MIIFLYLFPKNVKENISSVEMKQLKKLSIGYLNLKDKEIKLLIKNNIFKEVHYDSREKTYEIMDMIEEGWNDLSTVKDVSKEINEFYKSRYPEKKYPDPKHYCKSDVIRIRKKLKVSQIVFARFLNAKLTTVQKWERGVYSPNPYACRLLQILERSGIYVLQK